MITLIVVVKKDQHANLDSFPFRYGFSENKDFKLSIVYDSKPKVQNGRFGQRLLINNAKFINPITGDSEEGNFVLVRDAEELHYSVVTVIRTDKRVDKTLSAALKLFRQHKYVTVDNLINYFHPRYIEGKIKTHHDLKKYLIKLNSDNKEQINEIESVLKDAYNEIEKLKLDINDSQFENYNKYANSEEYSKDKAIAQGWGSLYDEAKEYADEAFNEYLNECNNEIEELRKQAGEMPMFLSWTMLEDNMRELHPNSSEKEFAKIMLGWKIVERVTNIRVNKLNEYLKKYPKKTTDEVIEKINLEHIELSKNEVEAYKYITKRYKHSSTKKRKK
jgi:hypothetical protein